MNRFRGKTVLAGIAAGALLGVGLATVTPAGAAIENAAAAIDWKSVWKQEIKPRADKRYFTKKKANARFYTKLQANSLFETKAAHDASLANYYTKAQSDANYYTKAQSDANYYTKAQSDANYYTKAQSDAKYAPYPKLVRGVLGNVGAGSAVSTGYSFGVTFDAAPAAHIIQPGGPVPAGCLGTVAAPDALPGHLCIFENVRSNVGSETVCSGDNNCPAASPFGFFFIAFPSGAGVLDITGSWAARPAVSVTAGFAQPHVAKNTAGTGASGR